MRKLAVNIKSLVDALEMTHENLHSYLDTQTGEVVDYLQDEDTIGMEEDEDNDPYRNDNRYIRIPAIESYESYRFMEEFIPTVKNKHMQEMLEVAITEKKPFRRFQDVLCRDFDERERWFKFKREIMKEWAIDWLEGEGIEAVEKPMVKDES